MRGDTTLLPIKQAWTGADVLRLGFSFPDRLSLSFGRLQRYITKRLDADVYYLKIASTNSLHIFNSSWLLDKG